MSEIKDYKKKYREQKKENKELKEEIINIKYNEDIHDRRNNRIIKKLEDEIKALKNKYEPKSQSEIQREKDYYNMMNGFVDEPGKEGGD